MSDKENHKKDREIPDNKTSLLKKVFGFLKEAKEIITAVSAIVAAIFFAINYFASQKELNCLKIESSKNYELVQTVLQINDLTDIWKLESINLERINSKRQKSLQDNREFTEAELKSFYDAKGQLENTASELRAARERRAELEKKNVVCE